MVGGSKSQITHLHPPAIQIFQLWQIYLNNVNPLLKINHAPTLQNQIVKASADLSNVAEPLEALMFAMYFLSVTSMPNEEVEAAFGVSKKALLARYHTASQQALINAQFMSSSELTTLQAFLLHLVSLNLRSISSTCPSLVRMRSPFGQKIASILIHIIL